jgi:hypothetical protein
MPKQNTFNHKNSRKWNPEAKNWCRANAKLKKQKK